jgi:Xaa-Pro dipeptidase
MAIRTYGSNAVDWEQRVDLGRLRSERLGRLEAALAGSSLGGLLSFDFGNIRYMTATHIGTWGMDKLVRFAVLPRGGKPVVWDFGSAARHHQLYNPWLDHSGGPASAEGARATGARAGISTLRGALHPGAGMAADVAGKVAGVLREHGLAGEPLGVDVAEIPVLAALAAEGIEVTDGQQVFLEARRIKTADEISLLTQACSMVDAAYQVLYEFLRPGVRENECVGLVSKVLYELGSEFVEGVNAISGERCSPHPHVYSDRLIRPGDPAFFDILHSFNGYRTCYYRTFAVGSASRAQRDAYVRCREYMDQAIAMVRPGVSTGEVVSVWPRATEFGFDDEMAAFALQYGHGVGLSIWEKPIFSRLVSLEHPEPLEEGMVFALETYWPAADGWSAARIEEEVVVTAEGCEVITKFPAEDLLVAGRKYWTAGGALDTLRESQSNLNTPAGRGEPTSAGGLSSAGGLAGAGEDA